MIFLYFLFLGSIYLNNKKNPIFVFENFFFKKIQSQKETLH
jgi:hypothetical protein